MRRGFVIGELAVVVVLAVVIAALLLVLGDASRRHARVGADLSKLKFIGGGTFSYAADNADDSWTFNWRAGESNSLFPDLNGAQDDIEAAADQAVDIIRRLESRPDFPRIDGWLPHVLFSHLVLADHLQTRLADPVWVSSADSVRQVWQTDPEHYDQLGVPVPEGASPRWPYSSSFAVVPAWFDRYQNDPDESAQSRRVVQNTSAHYGLLVPPDANLGSNKLSTIAFPSDKMIVHDFFSRHYGPVTFFGIPDTRSPLLMGDGSASVRHVRNANNGWRPNSQRSAIPSFIRYTPDVWEPPTRLGFEFDQVIGYYRWTRGGLLGRDFGGPEIDTGQPRQP